MRSVLPLSLFALLSIPACSAPAPAPVDDTDTGLRADAGSDTTPDVAPEASESELVDTGPAKEPCLPSSAWADEFTLEGALGAFCVAHIYTSDRVVGRSYTWGRHGGPLLLATDGSAQWLRLQPPSTVSGAYVPEWKPAGASGLPYESLSPQWTLAVGETTLFYGTTDVIPDQELRVVDAGGKVATTLHTRRVGGVAGRYVADGKAGHVYVLADSTPAVAPGGPLKPGVYTIPTCGDGTAGAACGPIRSLASIDGADAVDSMAVDAEGNVFAAYQYTDATGGVYHRIDGFTALSLASTDKKPVGSRVRGAIARAPNFLVARWVRLFYPSPNADGTVDVRAQPYGGDLRLFVESEPAVRMHRPGAIRLLGDDPRYLWLETPGGRFYAIKWK